MNQPTYIVLDTETCDQNIIQLCWYILNEKFQVIDKQNYYAKPYDYYIWNTKIHGIQHEYCVIKGSHIKFILHKFMDAIFKYNPQYIVGHNVSYDHQMIINEMTRYNLPIEQIQLIKNYKTFCTMNSSKIFLGLKNKKGSLKQPKLSEAYNLLNELPIDTKLPSAHNAFYDVQYTCIVFSKIYNLMKEVENILI